MLAAGVAISHQKAAGSWGDPALTGVKRYVGGGACYHQFPRMRVLGNLANRDDPPSMRTLFVPVISKSLMRIHL
jgi:hypothetical protein